MNKIGTLLILFSIATYVVCLYIWNPEIPGRFPACLLYSFTGIKCPGCGGQRAIHCLLHGELLRALRYNSLILTFLPAFVIGLYTHKLSRYKWYPYLGITVILLYAVVRNLGRVEF